MQPEKPIGRLTEAYLGAEISRRQLLEGALKLGLSATAAGALLAACTKDANDTSASPTTAGATATTAKQLSGKVQILVGFGTGNSPAQLPVQAALAAAFTSAHPGVSIDFLRVPSGSSDAATKLTTLIAGGQPPDLVLPAGLFGISKFVDQNVWLDLRPFFDRDGISLDRFLPETITGARVPNYFGPEGKSIIGVPIDVHDHAIAYNEELFAKAGVAPPPTSWSDPSWTLEGKFLDTARALTVDTAGKHPNEPGFNADKVAQYGVGNFFRETVFYDFGGHIYDEASKKARFDQPGAVAGIQFAADLVNVHKVMPSDTQVAQLGSGGGKGNEAQFAWRQGKLAMIDMCSCNIKTPYGTDVPFAWKAAALPAGPDRRFGFLNLDVGAIVAAGKNHDLAWEVLKFLAIEPANEKQLAYESYGGVPPLKETQAAFADGIARDLPKVDPKVWIDGFPSSSPENEAWFPAFSEVNDLIGKSFDSIMSGTPAATAMPQLQTQAQAKIDEWFKTHKLPR
ncbi:MAG: extracellular solute-binding protein [Acidimicrobiales bacterium]